MDEVRGADGRHPVAAVCDRFGTLLDELGDPTLWSVSDADVVDIVTAAEQVLRRATAMQTTAVGEAQRRELPARAGATSLTGWLSGLLTAKPQRAKASSRLAEGLAGLAVTRCALASGAVDAEQAQVIATAVHQLPDQVGPELRGKAEDYLLEQAQLHHAGVLANLASHLLEVIAPEVAEARLAERLQRDEAREAQQRNTFSAAINHRGRISLRGELDTESWAILDTALGPLAKPAPARDDGVRTRDPRTYNQRMADALVELARRQLAAGQLPTTGGVRPTVVVTIDWDSLVAGVGTGTLDTGITLSAQAIRRMGCDAQLIPTVLGSAGVPLDVGRSVRTFTGELRRGLIVRDRGCAFPGCTRPPSWCEGHHILHWIDGGTTSLANGVLLCGHHHRLIHRHEWQVRMGRHGRPEFIPPRYIDPDQRPRINTAHLRS